MTEQQRATSVSVAKDVLKSLSATTVAQGSFIDPKDETVAEITFGTLADKDLTAHLDIARNACEVCALGACFLSYLDVTKTPYILTKSDTVNGVSFHAAIKPMLLAAIGNRNMMLIEAAFERGGGWYGADKCAPDELGDFWDAVGFGKSFAGPVTRLTAIMDNIIANHGEFQPGEQTIG